MLKTDSTAPDGKRAPLPGEIFRNPNLAHTFKILARNGKKGFYEGPVADALIKVVQDLGGRLSLQDLKDHCELGTEEVDAISLKFNGQRIGHIGDSQTDKPAEEHADAEGVEIWEHSPNGQGIVALMALGIMEELERTGRLRAFEKDEHNCTEYLHALIESLRIAFADAHWFIGDPNVVKVPTQEMISRSYLAERAKLFDPEKANDNVEHGSPAHGHCDTVYFAVTDRFGNGISFINSNYEEFGTGIIPKGCGFTLQSRGANFELGDQHSNVFAPRKRPYHTIIPALVTNPSDQSLHSVYGVMGGFMQPQGHVQVLLNMLAFKQNPQVALDAPRICLGARKRGEGKVLDKTVHLEEGIGEDVAEGLRKLGHQAQIMKGLDAFQLGLFGRGQVIRCYMDEGKHVYSAGSDHRGDGAALPA